jgi:hypothetical protein
MGNAQRQVPTVRLDKPRGSIVGEGANGFDRLFGLGGLTRLTVLT